MQIPVKKFSDEVQVDLIIGKNYMLELIHNPILLYIWIIYLIGNGRYLDWCIGWLPGKAVIFLY